MTNPLLCPKENTVPFGNNQLKISVKYLDKRI